MRKAGEIREDRWLSFTLAAVSLAWVIYRIWQFRHK